MSNIAHKIEPMKKPKKIQKESHLHFRVTGATAKDLESEANANGLDMSSYIRHLIVTHPSRKK